MRIIYLISSIFLLILTGCYSAYKVSDFSSRDKFYEDFNKSANDKAVKVTLSNDSSFFVSNGAVIVNDTLCSLHSYTVSGNKKLSMNNIKNINYLSSDYKSGTILSKNGELYHATKINFEKDSIYFAYSEYVKQDITSVSNVKEIVYNNHLLGVPVYIGIGTATGFVWGLIVNSNNGNGTSLNPKLTPVLGGILYAASGLVLGAITGWFLGYDYIYYFNY
ncbi:MAG: hypothetical protein ACYC49_13510 [Ignavibacteriaceae bacterium]